MRIRTTVLSILIATLLPLEAGAPIFGAFPGLTHLIELSKYIVIAQIAAPPADLDAGGGGVYSINILAVLKGDIKPGTKAKAYLRVLPFFASNSDHDYVLLPFGFLVGDQHVLFLNDRDAELGAQQLSRGVRFKGTNCSGDAFRIPSRRDFSELQGRDPQKNITNLLNDRVRIEKEQLQALETTVHKYVNGQ